MKKFILFLLMLSIPFGVAGAATVNGDFEGNPIVQVTSNGQVLKVDELPAMIYKDHTVVPLAMLRQLGALVTWNPNTYSVNVTMPQSPATTVQVDPAKIEYERLLHAYQWLKDTDTAILTFSQQIQLYANLTNGSEFANQLNVDFDDLTKQYNEASQMAHNLTQAVSNSEDLLSIIKSEGAAFSNVQQTKNLLSFKLTGISMPEFEKQFAISLLNATRMAQKNLNNTNAIIHQLQLKNEILPDKTSAKTEVKM
ncbi:hypothetical protein [Paenibacillus qinlingensis]|uniref:Copper amine oxidase-like N-terminal domain-containing protein n=1 Tax=Paenibacillus qinlingensis TaxID=1837343 RepID=A0ABU1NZE6_9BACL|nr:hypothetical protein [Paenibacillus qinlingensis]MDR6552867.1 hypothetical protein [Paenibacillus qinlingensis]